MFSEIEVSAAGSNYALLSREILTSADAMGLGDLG
jgi:hypothetical protein